MKSLNEITYNVHVMSSALLKKKIASEVIPAIVFQMSRFSLKLLAWV